MNLHFSNYKKRGEIVQMQGNTMTSLFGLPDEVILTPLFESFPCREHQIRSLATLLHVRLLTVFIPIS